MKTLDDTLLPILADNLSFAFDPMYYLQVEAAGNIVAYRAYLADCAIRLINGLSLDSSPGEIELFVSAFFYDAPWFI